MSRQTKQFYAFSDLRVDVSERLLWRDGEKIHLTPKVFDLLLAFLENSHRTLEKEELCKRIWPESRKVDDANLSRNIFILRKALRDGHDRRRLIETVPRRGYRFLAEVREFQEERNRAPVEVETDSVLEVEEERIETIASPDEPSQQVLSPAPRSRFSLRWAAMAASMLIALLASMIYFLTALRSTGRWLMWRWAMMTKPSSGWKSLSRKEKTG
jgi:DNA-binding winged helix-turn-helix (wHTH) protein